jgi:alpha-1,2-mannosyltransferase
MQSSTAKLLKGKLNQTIPFRVALPWLLLVILAPCWLAYFDGAVLIMRRAVQAVLYPGTISLKLIRNDLIVFWPVSHLILTDHAGRLYDPTWFSAWRASHLEAGVSSYLQYPYPPPGLFVPLLIAPFNYPTAFLVWSFILLVPGVLLLRHGRVPWQVIMLGVANAAGVYSLWVGQFGILTGAMFITALLLITKYPGQSGLLFGALIIKPQAGLLSPIVLMARGQYRIVLFAALTVCLLSAAITALCGPAIWSSFFTLGLTQAHRILIAPFPTVYENSGVSVFWMMRSLGASITSATIVQSLSATGAIAFCWRAWRRPTADPIALITLTAALTLLVTPYGYTDDMCGFELMVGWLAWRSRKLEIADVLIWMWPALCQFISISLHMELTPLVLLVGATRVWKELDRIGANTPACYPIPL